MAKTRPTDTKARIQAVAVELFTRRGVQQTSLQDIAGELGITKPALYYHFSSREALLASLVQPLVDDMMSFIVEREKPPVPSARELLEDYFDLLHRNREILAMLVRDMSTLGALDLTVRVFEWRHRLMALMIGPRPTLAAQVRAVVAVGGLSDCAVDLVDVPMETIKPAAVAAAYAALVGAPVAPAELGDAPEPPDAPALPREQRAKTRGPKRRRAASRD
jgi:AcrR family transcriptional regulator